MSLGANVWKISRICDVTSLYQGLFSPGGPTQIYMRYASALINTWEKDLIFATVDVVLGIRGKFCIVLTLMECFWNNAHRHLGIG